MPLRVFQEGSSSREPVAASPMFTPTSLFAFHFRVHRAAVFRNHAPCFQFSARKPFYERDDTAALSPTLSGKPQIHTRFLWRWWIARIRNQPTRVPVQYYDTRTYPTTCTHVYEQRLYTCECVYRSAQAAWLRIIQAISVMLRRWGPSSFHYVYNTLPTYPANGVAA